MRVLNKASDKHEIEMVGGVKAVYVVKDDKIEVLEIFFQPWYTEYKVIWPLDDYNVRAAKRAIIRKLQTEEDEFTSNIESR